MNPSLKIWNGVLALLLVIALSGCSTTPEERAKENQGKHVTKAYTVIIQQMKFTPANLTINSGDTVIWINKDIVTHNVTEETTKEWASPNLSPGMSWSRVVVKSATYLCTIHPVMKGSLNVR